MLDLRLPSDVEKGRGRLARARPTHARPGNPRDPVILASGAVNSIEARRPAPTPRECIRVLVKPYRLDELLEQLSAVLSASCSVAESVPSRPGLLTRRQRGIAGLIAGGCTNQQIAQQPVLEVGAVANHVAQIVDRRRATGLATGRRRTS